MPEKNDSQIMVSILCLAYNHEKYIRQCLDGFVMQQTDFAFEVIIHDDASPDHTAEIIREYERKYPELIKPIYQTENQHSKGISITKECIFPSAKGKYIALCEGDDYWVDPMKLQKQFDIMELYPNCHLCCHNVLWVTQDGESRHKTCPNFSYKAGLYSSAEFVSMALSDFFHINSLFVRHADYEMYAEESLEFRNRYQELNVGDVPLYLYMAQLGDTFYFSDIMSHYRPWSNPSSWSSQKKTVSEMVFAKQKGLEAIRAFDQYTQYRYHEACLKQEQALEIKIAQFSCQYKKCLSMSDKRTLKSVIPSKKARLKIYIGAYFPWLIKKYDAKKLSGRDRQNAEG